MNRLQMRPIHEDEAVISTDLKGRVEGYKPENETQKEEEITEVNAVIPQDEPKGREHYQA